MTSSSIRALEATEPTPSYTGVGTPSTDERVRVLFLNDHLGYPGGVVHGAGTYFLSVLPLIDSELVDLHVCFLRGPHPVRSQLEAQGVHPVFLGRAKWDPRAFMDLHRLIRRHRIQVVHAAGVKGMLLGQFAARAAGCRTIVHLHDTEPLRGVMRLLQESAVSSTDVALCVSTAVSRVAVSSFGIPPERVRVLQNAVDLARFANKEAARARIRAELCFDDDASVIGLIGRFHKVKGHAKLIAAMPALLERAPDSVLVCVGDGATLASCKALVHEKGLGHAVRFTGQRHDVPELLAAVEIVAMPSAKEGLPFVALEALAAGRPIVGFDVGGMREVVIDGETGRLIPAGDIDRFVDALCEVLGDAKVRRDLSEGSRRHAKRFALDRHVRQLQDLYLQLGQGRGIAPSTAT